MQDTQCFCIEYISTPPTHTHTHGYMFLPNPSSTIPSAKGKKALITSLLSSSQKLALKNTKFAITQASIISLTDPISQDLDYLVNLIPSTLPTKVHIINSVQSLSHVWHFATPWIAALQASLSITNSRSLLKLMSIESVMPSSHLILCCPLLLLPPSPSQHQGFFQWVNSSHEVAKVLEFQLQHQSFQWIPRTDLL